MEITNVQVGQAIIKIYANRYNMMGILILQSKPEKQTIALVQCELWVLYHGNNSQKVYEFISYI